MADQTATDVLGRECSEQEFSLFEAYLDALGDDDVDEAVRLFDQFPAADRGPLTEFMQRRLDTASKPSVKLAPPRKEPRPDPNTPIIAMSENCVTVVRWGDEDEHPADDAALEAFRTTPARERRRLEGRRLTVKDCRRLAGASAKRAAPRRRGAGRPKAQATRSSARSGDSGEDGSGECSEPPSRRYCENTRCGADISHLGPLAYHCDSACKQAAWRDRCTRKLLDEKSGTIVVRLSCVCDPPHNTLEPGHCHDCGKPRGVVTMGWVGDAGTPARSFVATRGLPQRDLRVRPDRELSTKLRRTRKDWKAAA